VSHGLVDIQSRYLGLIIRTIEPLNARELEYLGNGRPPVDYAPDPGYTSGTAQDAPRQTEDMEVDELDDY
jgi:hypothetical protein